MLYVCFHLKFFNSKLSYHVHLAATITTWNGKKFIDLDFNLGHLNNSDFAFTLAASNFISISMVPCVIVEVLSSVLNLSIVHKKRTQITTFPNFFLASSNP
ncbi:hypothetical protein BpHYR1_023764 [Brachionus plicatilis]|uniref:Uncharacterized protein n=1 Tax=Brachionus plicatilis TaxID=10195 RepID=A0A3M7SMP1_BRAPC|nr:hypothetical protein BpHYR1_023764 [Brachionus plicatilis]